MSSYDVALEIGPDGNCMAHVLSLPGCMVRASSRDEALALLPDAIGRYHYWLRRHGEPSEEDDHVSIQVTETVTGIGPFDPSDAAALFADDNRPLDHEQLEYYLQLAEYGRQDLLALTEALPNSILQWQPRPQTMSIGRILRHIGNAEEWYVSRLVSPETLPVEWKDDGDLPIFSFLEMQRRTAAQRLRQLSENERSTIHKPQHFTDHPDEAWTARKALRRLLEHQMEHTKQVRETLALWRRHLLARLDGARAELLELFLSLDEETLTGLPLFEETTAKDLLAHIAAWDRFHAQHIALLLENRVEEVKTVVLDERNAALKEEHHKWDLSQALEALLDARDDLLQKLSLLPDERLHQPIDLPWGETTIIRQWIERRAEHDDERADDLRSWRKDVPRGTGPLALLLAALRASRAEMVALVELLPPAERNTRRLSDRWTIKDILAHVADWERFAVECLRAGRIRDMGYDGDVQAWNQAHATQRRDQPWQRVWRDFKETRREMLALLEEMNQEELASILENPRGGEESPYTWAVGYLGHEREHVAMLREALLSGQ